MITLNPATLTAYLLAVATVVSMLISQFVKPLLERVPALSPTLPDQTLHDAALRLANLLLTVAAVLVMAAANGQLTLNNALPTAGLILASALGSHSVYHLVSNTSASSAPASADNTSTASTPTPVAPLHQQGAPASVADAT